MGGQTAADVVSPFEPTVFPEEPRGSITVNSAVTINLGAFATFKVSLDEVVTALGGNNSINSEVKDQLIAYLNAGKTLAEAPKPPRWAIMEFLAKPLKWLIEKAGSQVIHDLAATALAQLGAATGLW
jgi:hypothetical protein